jgi:exopolysaccharide biosynthesis protein
VVVHGRNLLKGYKGATLKELAEIGSQLGLTDLINLDGGGSIKVLDQNGIDIEDAPGNRAVDTMICFYKED